MFFAKNEIVELEDKSYLVIDTAIEDNESYYLVQESDLENNVLIGEEKLIKAHKIESELYIEEITDEELINKLFRS